MRPRLVASCWSCWGISFANPAISIARSLSNTFAGIAPSHVPAFILAQLLGALAAIPIARVLFAPALPPAPLSGRPPV